MKRLFKFISEVPKEYDHKTKFGNFIINGGTFFIGCHPDLPPIKIDTVTGEWEIVEPGYATIDDVTPPTT